MLVLVVCALVIAQATFAAPYPAGVSFQQIGVTNGTNLIIQWNPISVDIYGRALTVTNYNIYASTNPWFVPDFLTRTNRLAMTNQSRFIHSGALASSTNLFYYVTAQASDGTETVVVTDMVCKITQQITCPPGSNVFAWLGIPSSVVATNASTLAAQMGVTGKVYRLVESNQSYQVWDTVSSTGTNFRIAPGEAYGVEVSTTANLRVLGRYGAVLSNNWIYNTNAFNHHWMSIPANSTYSNASSLADDIPAVTRLALYSPTNGQFLNWFTLDGQWMGTNFLLSPLQGVIASVASNSTWSPRLIYPQAQVDLAAGAGFVDLTGMQATGSVATNSSDIVEYAWDGEGDGTFEVVSTSPLEPATLSFTNPTTAYPTYRIKDARGFYALASRRYEALSMGLSFGNQAFRPGLGETSAIVYASSTGGVFSSWIVDADENIVRMLETNIVHSSGYIRETSDDAGQSIYGPGGNFIGLNGGSGMSSWSLSPSSNTTSWGWFMGSSTGNGSSTNGGIDSVSGRAWGGYANNGAVANANRGLLLPIATGDTFSVDMDNGWIGSGASVGFSLQNAASQTVVEVYYRGADATNSYKVNDGSGEHNIGIPWTEGGIHVEITLTSASTYSGVLRPYAGTNVSFGGTLMNPSEGRVVSQVRLFNAYAGNGSPYNAYWNNLKVSSAPTASLAWDGRDGLGQVVSNGLYYLVVEQTVNGFIIRYDPKPILLGSNVTSSVTDIIVPAQFNIYAGRQFPIQYTLPNPAKVTIWIQDELFQPIAMVCSNVLRSAGKHTEYWDGRLSNGAIIEASQIFHATVSAIGTGQNALIVDVGLPPVDKLIASTPKFLPASNPYGNHTNALTLSYQLSSPADLRVVVRRADGQVVQNALDLGKTTGANQTGWPGTDGNGALVPAGLYSVTLQAESGAVHGDSATIWVEIYY